MADPYTQGMTAGVEQRGNVVLAILAGLVAAAIGSGIWLAVEIALQWQVGYVALAIGALVGLAVRTIGHGRHVIYGVIGAALTLAGCLGGEILWHLYQTTSAQQSMYDLARSTDYVQMIHGIFTKMDPIGYLIYGIGIVEGYQLSIAK